MLYALCTALALALLGLDQWVKHYVTVNIPLGEAQPFLPGLVELRTVHNYGAAWSSFSGMRWLLVAVTSVIVIAVAVVLLRRIVRHPLGVAAGFLILLFPGGGHSQAGLLLMGLGCAPIYPSVIHSTPSRFGAELSQAVIGVQMAGAYIGSSLMPPFFGFLADHLGASLYPYYLLVLLVVMALMHQRIIPGKHVQTSL